jgi:DNA-binding transcriptional LysR family regulator
VRVWVVTPTQLRAFAEVVRLGSVKAAARHLAVTEAAISLHVAALRKELDDPLFLRAGSGIAFTPGGVRLAGRAVELLGLQDRTRREVRDAAAGRRVLRMAATGLFAEHAAPGLIELFSTRAKDLSVELSVLPAGDLTALVSSLAFDLAIGPAASSPTSPTSPTDGITCVPFLRHQVVVVAAPHHPAASRRQSAAQLAQHMWMLGPSSTDPRGEIAPLLRHHAVPEEHQRIFQSHAAALEQIKAGAGIGPALSGSVQRDLAEERLARVDAPLTVIDGTWTAYALPPDRVTPPARELLRFITTPRATQAMLSGTGAGVTHFRPSVHVTLWS